MPSSSPGPRRLISPNRRKYGGKLPSEESNTRTKASSPGARSSVLVAFSVPIVLVRADPGGAEQNDPAPCVGHTDTSSPSPVSRRNERYWARANSSVRSGDTRSVRAAEPTSSDPPVNTPTGRDPSSNTNARCSWVCPGVAHARSTSPLRSTSSPSRSPVCANSRRPAADANTCAPSVAASWRDPDRKSACRWVSTANAIRSPRRCEAARTARRSRLGSSTKARPVAQIQQVRRVTQALVDDRHDQRCCHRAPPGMFLK